jgi:hypothetical protein
MGVKDLFGAWKLISIQFVIAETGESMHMYGADPLGYIVFTPDERMMTIITSNVRTALDGEAGDAGDAALFRSMMAYCGPFRIEGNQFITKVDVSWHPQWLGTEQARNFAVADDILSITTAETSHPMFPGRKGHGVLKWQRASAF